MTDDKEKSMEVITDGLGRVIRLPTVLRPAHVEKRPQRKQTPPEPLPPAPAQVLPEIKTKPKARDITIGSCPVCKKRYLMDDVITGTLQYGEDKTVIWPCVKHRKPAA